MWLKSGFKIFNAASNSKTLVTVNEGVPVLTMIVIKDVTKLNNKQLQTKLNIYKITIKELQKVINEYEVHADCITFWL